MMEEIRRIASSNPDSLMDAVSLRDRKVQLAVDYNILSVRSNAPKIAFVFLVMLIISFWRPLVLLSLILSDLVITRLRLHIKNSFSYTEALQMLP